jgi:hypothetical protein
MLHCSWLEFHRLFDALSPGGARPAPEQQLHDTLPPSEDERAPRSLNSRQGHFNQTMMRRAEGFRHDRRHYGQVV